jgi:diguanylate cyclase (GGDEF)-like protein/PAS domain S-box-containing protein
VRNPRLNGALVAFALVVGGSAFVLPLTVTELLGVVLVVAGAYFGGVRGGLVTALWAIFVATMGFFVFANAGVGTFVFSLIAYGAVGVGLGVGVDRFSAQRQRLIDTAERAEAAQRQLMASQKRYRLLFEVSNDAVYLHGLDAAGEPTRFVAVNDTACEALGYTREEMLALTPRAIDAAPKPGQLRRVMERLLLEERVVYESVRLARDGRRLPVEISSSLTDVDGELLVLSISRDISARKKAERRLEELTLRDELTGLLNRRGFYVMLPEQSKRAKRAGSKLLVLYGDIDGFKAVNDSEGHARGDEVLAAVAEVFRRTFRETDLLARLGGDEFCVVAETAAPDPETLGRRLDEALSHAGRDLGLQLSMSHGIVTVDWRGLEDPDELLTRVDMLMYRAKRDRQRGGGQTAAGDTPAGASEAEDDS